MKSNLKEIHNLFFYQEIQIKLFLPITEAKVFRPHFYFLHQNHQTHSLCLTFLNKVNVFLSHKELERGPFM